MLIPDFIERYIPCKPACEWLATLPTGSTMRDAWLTCRDPARMAWCVDKVGTKRDRVVAGIALVRRTPVGDGRVVFALLADPRSRDAILTAERWVAGEADDEELAAAAWAAWAASASASAAAWAAWAAAAAEAEAAWAEAARAAAPWTPKLWNVRRSAQPDIMREALPGFFLEADHA
jgi:hypothetical protein